MSFKKKKFDLSKPLNIICGRNGSGKSSILEGLALSFQVKERNNSVGAYIRKVPTELEESKPKKAIVILKAEYLGKPLTIRSEFSESGGRKITRLVEYNGEEYKNTAGNKFLSKFFTESKMELAFSLQGNDRYLTTSGATNLKNFMGLLNLCYDEKFKSLGEMNKEINSQYNTVSVKYHEVIGKVKMLEDLQVDLTKKISEISIFIKNNPKKSAEDLLKKLEDMKEQQFKLNKYVSEYNSKLEEYNNYIRKTSLAKSHIENLKQDIASLDLTKAPSTEEEERRLEAIIVEIDKGQTKLSNIKEASIHIDAKIAECLKNFNLIKNGQCPVCKSILEAEKLSKDDQEIKELQKALEEHKKEFTEVNNERNELIKEKQDLVTTIELAKRKKVTYEHNLEMKQSLEKSLVKAQEDEKELLEHPVAMPDPVEDKELKDLRNTISHTESEIHKIADFNNEVNYENKKLDENLKSLEEYKGKVEETKNERDKLNAEKEKYEDRLNIIADSNYILGAVPKKFLNGIVIPVQNKAKVVVAKFGYDFRIKYDGEGLFFELGKNTEDGIVWLPYQSQSSFEKIMTNIAFIISMQSYLGLPFMTADEIDNSADPINIKIFKNLMDDLSSELQVVLITHDSNSLSEYIQNERVSFTNLGTGGSSVEKPGK